MRPVLIFDQDYQYIGQLDDYEYLSWTRKWRRPHSFEIHINRYKNNVDKLQKGNFIIIQRGGKYRAGRIEHKEVGLSSEGKLSENWVIAGKNVASFFENRLTLHLTGTGSGYDVQSGNVETVMRHYVNVNCISPSDTNRIVPNLALGVNLARGPSVQYRARFQTIAEVLEDLSYASGYGYEVNFDLDSNQFVFDVLEGRDLTPAQSDHPHVIFSPEFGNVSMLGFRNSEIDMKNVAYVAGQGEAAARTVLEISNGALSGFDRREVLIDARDLETTAQLQQRGHERLAELSDELVMEVEHHPGGPFTYLVDFDLGDIVHTRYPDIGTMDARIVEVVEELDVTGDRFKLVLGKEWPDLISVIGREQKRYSLEVRR